LGYKNRLIPLYPGSLYEPEWMLYKGKDIVTMDAIMTGEERLQDHQVVEEVVPRELRPYMKALPDCPFPALTKLEWVSQLYCTTVEPPYPFPYDTKLDWVKGLADLDCAMVRDRERALQRYEDLVGTLAVNNEQTEYKLSSF